MKETALQIFEQRHIRSAWSEEEEKWYSSVVDVVEVLTDQPAHQDARNYWKVLKNRLMIESNETVTNCNGLKLQDADGKMRFTD